MDIHIVGDSHAKFSFKDFKRLNVTCHHIGPWTMHRVGRDRPSFLRYAPKNCILVTSFGEIDIRCHLDRFIKKDPAAIALLVSRYLAALKLAAINFRRLIIYAPPPPCIHSAVASTNAYPVRGTDTDRVRYHTEVISLLHAQTLFSVLDLTREYSDASGLLRADMSDGCVHIKNTTYVEQELAHILEEGHV